MLIASPELLEALKERIGNANGEVLTFSASDARRAVEVITKRRPHVVALERLFAATSRGAALINRIKADPSLVGSEIRVLAHDSDYSRVSPRRPAAAAPVPSAATTAAPVAVGAGAMALDQRGTRRAPRFRMPPGVAIVVDGDGGTIVDLSRVGAQVVTDSALNPNQRVRTVLTDSAGVIRFNASVVWVKFEASPATGSRYRAGLDFVDADGPAIDGFCDRHKAG